MSKLLIDDRPLMVLPRLATEIGLNEAVVLQQIHYWLVNFQTVKDYRHYHEGQWWVYNTAEGWQENFPFWSTRTVQRALQSLRDRGLVQVGNFNKKGYDRTLWYTLDYEAMDKLEESIMTKWQDGSRQDVIMDDDKMAPPIPETTTDYAVSIPEKEEAPDGAGFFPDNGSGPQDHVESKAEPEPPRPDYFDVAVRSHKKREERKAAGLAPSYSEGEGAVDGEPNSEALGAFCTIVGCDLMGLKAKVRTAWERELHRIAQNNETTSAELAGAILFEYGKGGAAAWKVVRSPFAKGFQEALPAVLAIWRSTSHTTRRRAGGGIVITNA